MSDHKRGIVLALFDSEAAADSAVEELKAWDKLDDDVKLDSIGMIVLDEKGKLKTHKLGRRRGIAKGVGVGVVVEILAGFIVSPLLPPLTFGLIGATRKSLDLSEERREFLAKSLQNGKAAVGVLVKYEEMLDVDKKLAELGGSTDTFELSPDLESAAAEVAEKEGQS